MSEANDTGDPLSAGPGLRQAAARGTGVTLLVQLGRTVIQFASMVALARLLLPEDFGLVAMVLSVIGIADLVRDFGLSLATMQSERVTARERSNLFWANLALGFACTVAVLALGPLIVALYDEPRLGPILLVLAWVFTVSGFTTQFRAGLARDMRYKLLGVTDLLAQALAAVTAVALAALGLGVAALVAQQLVAAVVGAALSAFFARWWPGLPRRSTSIRHFMRFGGGVFGTQAISYATKNVDNIAIGATLGAATLGFYGRAYQLMMMPLNQINAPMTNVAVPVLSRVQRDDERFLRYLSKSQLVACYVTATLFAMSVGLAEPIVRVLFGTRWLEVVPIFAVLALGGMFRAVAQIAYWAYLARGKSGALLRQRLVTGPLMVALLLAGLPWGAVGVAAGHSVAAFLSWWIAVWHVGRATDLNTRPLLTNAARILVLVGVPAGLLSYAATWLPVPAVVHLLAGVALVGVYVAAAAALLGSVRADLALTASFAREALGSRGVRLRRR